MEIGQVQDKAIETQSSQRRTGTVVWWQADKRYGFLRPEGALVDVFIPAFGLGEGHKALIESQRVWFRVEPGPKGPQAVDVLPQGTIQKLD